MTIRVGNPGFFTTIQDAGRYLCAHLGISPAGAADRLSFRMANLLVGNNENAPALEMTLLGGTLEFQANAVIALCGADCKSKLGERALPMNTAFEVPAGAVLRCGAISGGARCYLAVRNGIAVPLVLGSASTDVRGGFGGFQGRRLQRGDELPVSDSVATRVRTLRPNALAELRKHGPVRITRGAQQKWFGEEDLRRFLSTPYTVTEQSDRTGLRLRGETLTVRDNSHLLTDGIPLGAIQVPADGQPIILFVDQQTTGGYPKIANVIAADMHRIGQLRPRDTLRFTEVSIAEAVQLLAEQERWLAGILA